jgi:hypothetical protein
MQETKWQPSGEAVDNVRCTLSRAIRSKLPGIEMLNQPNWAFGTVSDPEQKLQNPKELVHLKTLNWRLLDALDWQKRAAARGVFSGQAWIQGQLIDFTGDSVRDLATGSFLELQLLTMVF